MVFRSSRHGVLPAEIVGMIFDHLSQKDLTSIALTSATLRSIVEPFLYTNVILHSNSCDIAPLLRFSRTILQKPELAAHTKSLVISACGPFCVHPRDIVQTLKKASDELDLDQCRAQITHISGLVPANPVDCCLTFLLLQLRALRDLFVSAIHAREGHAILGLVESTLSHPHQSHLAAFRGLRRLSYMCTDDAFEQVEHTCRQSRSLLFTHLTNLSHLSISLDNTHTLLWPKEPIAALAPLTSLELTLATEHNLLELLQHMNRLERLSWTIVFHPPHPRERASQIDLEVLSSALEFVRNTLVKLEIKGKQRYLGGIEGPHLTCTGSLQSLSGFDRLQSLELPFQLLAASFVQPAKLHGIAVIPATATHLIINHDLVWCGSDELGLWEMLDRRWTEEALYEFILEDLVPSLRRSHVRKFTIMMNESIDHDTTVFWSWQMESFHKICEELGLHVEFGRRSRLWRLENFLHQWPLKQAMFSGMYECDGRVHRSRDPAEV